MREWPSHISLLTPERMGMLLFYGNLAVERDPGHLLSLPGTARFGGAEDPLVLVMAVAMSGAARALISSHPGAPAGVTSHCLSLPGTHR